MLASFHIYVKLKLCVNNKIASFRCLILGNISTSISNATQKLPCATSWVVTQIYFREIRFVCFSCVFQQQVQNNVVAESRKMAFSRCKSFMKKRHTNATQMVFFIWHWMWVEDGCNFIASDDYPSNFKLDKKYAHYEKSIPHSISFAWVRSHGHVFII